MDKKYMIVKQKIVKEFCQAPAHTKLPSERELIEHFGYSRPTIQKALFELEKDGSIYRIPRRGAFVSDAPVRLSLDRLSSFKEDMLRTGDVPATRLISFEKVPADELLCEKLDLKPGEEVFKIVRLHCKNGDPIILDINYFCAFAIHGIGAEAIVDSIYEYIEQKNGMKLANAYKIVDAVLPDEQVASLLGVERNEPVIKVDMVASVVDGRKFEYTISYQNPKKYCLEIHSVR